MRKSIALFACFLVATATAGQAPVAPFELSTEAKPLGALDEVVFAAWKKAGVEPARPASDSVFLRRAFLDVIGTLPTAEEAAAFLTDTSPTKRAALIDRLLARDEFVDYWSLKWGDVLRIKSEFPIRLWPNAVQAYSRWLHTAIRDNTPFDRIARQLLVSNGSNFRVPEVNFYRAVDNHEPKTLAAAVALTFMGTRTAPKGMDAFFSRIAYKSTKEWKEEIVYFDSTAAPLTSATLPDGKPVRIAPGQDPREVFANWLLAPDNPWFARAVVNRIWYWLLGRGIVHEPDDIRADNPPSNPALLAYLERELVASHYDLKHIYRLILNSAVYQLSSIPGEKPAPEGQFARYPVRRLDAEVLLDAISRITGSEEEYSSPIPEPFTFLPDDQSSIDLTDGSIGSALLDQFGRPARDTGLVSERNNQISAAQRLTLLNSTHFQTAIQQSARLRALVQPGGGARGPIDRLYLTILSRYPTPTEVAAVSRQLQPTQANRWQEVVDLAWALMNSAEFLYRH